MSQATDTGYLSLEELPPHVISFLSDYPPSERCRVAKKLLVYAVSKLEQKSEKQQNPTRQYYQLPTWWSPENNKENRENKKNDKKHSKLPNEEQLPRRMIDEITQTSDVYIRAPEKVPKGKGTIKSNGSEFEKKRFIPISSSPETSNHDIILSENESNIKYYNMHNKDPFFVASTKRPTTYEHLHLKKSQQTKNIRHSPRTRQKPTKTLFK